MNNQSGQSSRTPFPSGTGVPKYFKAWAKHCIVFLAGIDGLLTANGPGAWAEESQSAPKRSPSAHVETFLNLADLHKKKVSLEEWEKTYTAKSGASYARLLNDLGLVCHDLGEFGPAEKHFLKARAIFGKLDSEAAAIVQHSLARLYQDQGDFARSQRAYQQAVAQWQKEAPRGNIYQSVLLDFASLHLEWGDLDPAETLCKEVLSLLKAAKALDTLTHAICLHNLGVLHEKRRDYPQAEKYLLADLKISRGLFKAKDPQLAHSQESLALLYTRMSRYDQAMPLYGEALATYQTAFGHDHPAYARTLNNRGYTLALQGKLAEADKEVLRALNIRVKVLGPRHLETADSWTDLARIAAARGQLTLAQKHIGQALAITRNQLDLAAYAQSERQQLAMARAFRERLDLSVALTLKSRANLATTYDHVLRWKGSVFSAQLALRSLRDNPATSKVRQELRLLSQRLATLAWRMPDPQQRAAYDREIEKLLKRRESLEGGLAEKQGPTLVRLAHTTADLQTALPSGGVLVDLFQLGSIELFSEHPRPREHLVAFIVRAKQPLELIDLGSAEPILAATERWRSTLRRKQPVHGNDDPARELQRLLWEPIAARLEGVQEVLLAPDGAVGRLPFAALPGREAGKFLIEERSITLLPVPQLLPDLARPRSLAKPSLLLVGGVDYDADPGVTEADTIAVASQRSASLQQWKKLEATAEEVVVIKDHFEQEFPEDAVKLLRGKQATEASFRRLAPGQRWLHVATHGFFASPQFRSAWAGSNADRSSPRSLSLGDVHPGLLSGLVLAGSNRPAQPNLDDGILTALEVAELDLTQVEMAVLSACETGLGPVAGGEGILGLQRAFQVAGAKTVVASLWSVDDDATRKLMIRFYVNLWQKKLPRAEALRQAQLWMLQEGVTRGIVRLDNTPGQSAPRTPPYYWAPFVLSGDWR